MIVSQDVVMALSDEGCVEENNKTLVRRLNKLLYYLTRHWGVSISILIPLL